MNASALPIASVKRASRTWRETALAYFALTKPRIILLLLVTTVPAMVMATDGMPSLGLVAATLVGGAVAAGGANAVNCYIDRDLDRLMARTKRRPLPAGQVEPESALVFGLALGVLAFIEMTVLVNLLSAFLTLAAMLFYVLVYTVWLKRSTPQNIVIGGAAGAMPPLIGWAAVTNAVELPAFILFAIIFFWTPPHFWCLALRYVGDYRAAGIPMLPVSHGEEETRWHILLYSLLLVGVTLLLYPAQATGWVYLLAALLLGGRFVALAVQLWREATPRAAHRLFKYSTTYLALLFGAMVLDQILLG
jgi:protoheme IX farnesyltransferase